MSETSISDSRTKILVIGPPQCGKTVISNFVADTTESTSKEYRPTKGVRILELENEIHEQPDKLIELWDCSGDRKYEDCWAALRYGACGVVLVADPERCSGQDLLIWYNEFVVKTGLRPGNVMVLLFNSNQSTNDSAIADFRLPPQMSGIRTIPLNIDHDEEALRNDFNFFLAKIFKDDEES
uniref:Rab-like protein 5 n=1 Tax=Panagrellus redivivus TaxID=6233 RepID=A0A7E4V2K9_PANRE